MKQQTEDVVYVEDNYTLMCNYLYDKFPNSIEQREFMQSTLESWENAKITRSILEDYQRTNEEKRKYFYDKFCSGEPKIHITIADRKQGKTMFTVGDMLFELRRRGWKIYTAFPFPELWINSSGELGSYFFFWNQPTKQKIKELKEKGFFKFNSTFVLPSEIPRDEQQKTFRYYPNQGLNENHISKGLTISHLIAQEV